MVAAAAGFSGPQVMRTGRSAVRMSTNPNAPIKVGINGARPSSPAARTAAAWR
jgi:hypothetical protein